MLRSSSAADWPHGGSAKEARPPYLSTSRFHINLHMPANLLSIAVTLHPLSIAVMLYLGSSSAHSHYRCCFNVIVQVSFQPDGSPTLIALAAVTETGMHIFSCDVVLAVRFCVHALFQFVGLSFVQGLSIKR